jgi:hypothetical protein
MNAADVPSNNEKGLHVLKGAELVIFAKNDAQPSVEKFWATPPSNAWGNGVGKIGGPFGMVGMSCSDMEVVCGVDERGGVDESEGVVAVVVGEPEPDETKAVVELVV